jgi:hypothetical protein
MLFEIPLEVFLPVKQVFYLSPLLRILLHRPQKQNIIFEVKPFLFLWCLFGFHCSCKIHLPYFSGSGIQPI